MDAAFTHADIAIFGVDLYQEPSAPEERLDFFDLGHRCFLLLMSRRSRLRTASAIAVYPKPIYSFSEH